MKKFFPHVTIVLLLTVVLSISVMQDTEWETHLQYLMENYNENKHTGESAFIFLRAIVSHFLAVDNTTAPITLLGRHIQQVPEDPYNSYYLFMIASQYMNNDSPQLAKPYYVRSINKPDVYVDNQSVHLQALSKLIHIETQVYYKIRYINRLLADFYPVIDNPGLLYHTLGTNYSTIGDWENAYKAYMEFLNISYENRRELPAYRQIERWVALYNSDRTWTFRQLNTLVSAIKSALYNKNIRNLLSHRAKQNFFTMSWNQETFDENSKVRTFDIGAFLRRSTVRFASDLERTSNNTEAYLRTWGWSHRIPVWYLYFRKIDFEADPAINGSWEWAGIFFGDSL